MEDIFDWIEEAFRRRRGKREEEEDEEKVVGGGGYRLAEEGDLVRVEVDMPGLEPSDISVKVSPDGTRISVRGERGGRRYSATVPLPRRVDPSTVRAVYRRGVLHITAKTAREAEEAEVPVEVED